MIQDGSQRSETEVHRGHITPASLSSCARLTQPGLTTSCHVATCRPTMSDSPESWSSTLGFQSVSSCGALTQPGLTTSCHPTMSDSWPSTSSGVHTDRQHAPVVQPQYMGQVYHQQQQYHLYDWANHHTWAQVETSQLTRRTSPSAACMYWPVQSSLPVERTDREVRRTSWINTSSFHGPERHCQSYQFADQQLFSGTDLWSYHSSVNDWWTS